ncbi:MAG: hypothetical protein LUO85_05535 [Methanomassiliicoccales archaeon]|nr:hypothetical protein [Methanomassiliicoccales archaeon]
MTDRFQGGHGWFSKDGEKFTYDVVVHSDGRVERRKVELSLADRGDYFHTPLSERELDFMDQEKPEVLIIGAGFKGMLQLTPRAKEKLSGRSIIALTTDKAIEMMNREKRPFAAILHLTC